MQTIEAAAALGDLRASLVEEGYTVRQVEDVTTIPDLIERVEKPYLTPLSSPLHNDLTEGNSLWLVAEKGNEPVFLGCARFEDLGRESIADYWSRSLKRAYPNSEGEGVIENVRQEVDRTIGGRIVYFGDLFVKGHRRGSRKDLRTFVAIGHLAVSLKWNPEWTYCFVREADVLRGAAALYGFTMLYPNPFSWVNPPYPRDNSEWLAALPRSEVWHCVETALKAVSGSAEEAECSTSQNQEGEIQDPDVAVVALDR